MRRLVIGAPAVRVGPFGLKGYGTPIAGPIEGLAFRQDRELYAAESTGNPATPTKKIYHVEGRIPANCVYIAGSDDLIIDLASEPALYCVEYTPPPDDPWGDLGDAPDRTNNWGRPMSTYGGTVVASFPAVHCTAERQPSGPKHLSGSSAVLGACVSLEKEADMLPDDDFVSNIDPYLA